MRTQIFIEGRNFYVTEADLEGTVVYERVKLLCRMIDASDGHIKGVGHRIKLTSTDEVRYFLGRKAVYEKGDGP